MSVSRVRWGEERNVDGTTRKYWVSSLRSACYTDHVEIIIKKKSHFPFSDCCKLLGKELGGERLFPHRPRRERVRDRSVCDWRVGPNHHGGHAEPSPPPSPPADLDAKDGTMPRHLFFPPQISDGGLLPRVSDRNRTPSVWDQETTPVPPKRSFHSLCNPRFMAKPCNQNISAT